MLRNVQSQPTIGSKSGELSLLMLRALSQILALTFPICMFLVHFSSCSNQTLFIMYSWSLIHLSSSYLLYSARDLRLTDTHFNVAFFNPLGVLK